MSSGNQTLLPSTHRPLPLLARKDLAVSTVDYCGERCWVVKDPLSLEYYRLRAEQYALLLLLDGQRSCENLRTELMRQFPALRPTLAHVRQLAADLYEKRLVWSQRAGQHEVLHERMRERRIARYVSAARNLLYIRLPGWDPHRLLVRSYPAARWLFHPATVYTSMVMLAVTWAYVLLNLGDFQRRMGHWEQFASWQMVLLLWGTLSVTKILHELGHALACRHYGGECHEIGVAFLIFSPCLYCDVSDSWMLASRRKRMAIAAAGMYVECILSSLAVLVWWNSHAGLLQQLCLAVFLITHITTLLFNLNPLLRLDGYYILCDWLEIPNLRSKADSMFERIWLRWCWGIKLEPAPSTPSLHSQVRLGLFAVVSAVYRWSLTIAVCYSLYHLLHPYGLGTVGLAIGVASLLFTFLAWGNRMVDISQKHRDQMVKSYRPLVTAGALVLAIFMALWVPVPWYITVPMVVQPHQAEQIYIDQPGRLVSIHVQPGDQVKRGDVLLELQDTRLTERLIQLQSALATQLVEKTARQAAGETAAAAAAEESCRALHAELAACRQQAARLKVLAPCAGTVVAPPELPVRPEGSSARTLSRWDGTPLEVRNLGCYLTARTHALSISPQNQFAAVLHIEQFHRTDFQAGQPVKIQFDASAVTNMHSTIDKIATVSYETEAATEVASLANSPAEQTQGSHPAASGYQAVAVLPAEADLLMTGMRGQAQVLVARRTAWEWGWRYLRASLNFIL